MDPNALDTAIALPLAVDKLPIPLAGPKTPQLSPIPGNIYKSNCFFYDCKVDTTQDDFRAVFALALVHGHSTVVNECPNL
jgi:hypothetical protein